MAFIFFMNLLGTAKVYAEETLSKEEIFQIRMNKYLQYHDTFFPWYYLAAVDQYERNIQDVRKDIPKRNGIVAIQFSDESWVGVQNPNSNDTSPTSITYFGGMGLDGNGDGLANRNDDEDVLYTMATYLTSYGVTEDDFKLALSDYYKNEMTVICNKCGSKF